MAAVLASGSCGEIRRKDADISSAQREVEPHEKEVFGAVEQDKWEEVVEIYKTNPSSSTTINQVRDTILYPAILMGKQEGVIKLLTLVEKQDKERMENLVQTPNKWGNTPLHQAAFRGMDKVCSFIANHNCTEKVVCCLNDQKETPLHVAVLHGRKQTFFALQMVIEANGWRAEECNTRGDSMLHSAIAREHFGE
ncbi:homeobox protein Wariai-like [Cocos nucifera]|nr:homeobox protein Wariai-like [Cocos nucifera]